jgi:hypothetical protein
MPDFSNALTHDNMLTILREAYDTVEEPQDTVEEPLPESVTEPKRSSTASQTDSEISNSISNTNVASDSRMPKRRKVDAH